MSNSTIKIGAIAAAIALVVSLVVGFGFVSRSSPTAAPATLGSISGTTYSAPDNYTNGLSLGGNEVTFTREGVIAAGQNEATWCNIYSGKMVQVDYAEMDTVSTASINTLGVASSTMRFSVGTTTAAITTSTSSQITISPWSAPYATLIDNQSVATSTYGSPNSDVSSGSNEKGTVSVAPAQCVYFMFRQDSTGVCSGSTCEQATSTNRGFNVKWYLSGHYSS